MYKVYLLKDSQMGLSTLRVKGMWGRRKRSEDVNSDAQSELDRAHCRGPAQVLPSIYLQPP